NQRSLFPRWNPENSPLKEKCSGEPKRMLRGRGRRWPRGIYRSAGAVQPFARRLRAQSRAATFASVLAKASSSGHMAKKIPLPVKLQCLGKNRDVEDLAASQPMLDALLVAAAKRQHRVVHRDNF